jgi:hypothetical protein
MDQPGQFFMILLKLMNTKNTLKVSVYKAYSSFAPSLLASDSKVWSLMPLLHSHCLLISPQCHDCQNPVVWGVPMELTRVFLVLLIVGSKWFQILSMKEWWCLWCRLCEYLLKIPLNQEASCLAFVQQNNFRTKEGRKQISLIRIKKSPFSQFRKKQSKVNTSSTSHGKTRKDKTENKGSRNKNQKKPKNQKKHKSGMDNSVSLTPVQAPLTVVCRIVYSLPQLPHWLHQLPTVGKGQWKH